MVKRILFLMAILLGGASLLWAATVTVDGVVQGTLESMSVDQSGNVNITCVGGSDCTEQVVVTPSALSFTVTAGQLTNPPQQVVSVKNGCSPAASLVFSVTNTPSWIEATPSSGNGTLNVTVKAAQITQSTSGTITMNVQGAAGTVQKTVTVNVTYSNPGQIATPLLIANDVNMLYGEATGIQTVNQGDTKFYKFVLTTQCNRVVVSWASFDWVGEIDMIVKKDSVPTLADYNNAVSGGYPALFTGPNIWYSLKDYSADTGESVGLTYVSAGTYYIMMKNTNSAASKFKVSFAPSCNYSR